MIDTHCHLDLYPHPEVIAEDIEAKKITTVAVTNLPSHFAFSQPYVTGYRHIHLALGLHPLIAESHSTYERIKFKNKVKNSFFIGEVGLDFSSHGKETARLQLETFRFVIELVQDRPHFITLHSRGAEEKVGELLDQYGIQKAVFHWYSGPLGVLDTLVQKGHYFSVNTGMVSSKKGQTIISHIPVGQILTETDGPYLKVNNQSVQPKDIRLVLVYLSQLWDLPISETEKQIEENYKNLIGKDNFSDSESTQKRL